MDGKYRCHIDIVVKKISMWYRYWSLQILPSLLSRNISYLCTRCSLVSLITFSFLLNFLEKFTMFLSPLKIGLYTALCMSRLTNHRSTHLRPYVNLFYTNTIIHTYFAITDQFLANAGKQIFTVLDQYHHVLFFLKQVETFKF